MLFRSLPVTWAILQEKTLILPLKYYKREGRWRSSPSNPCHYPTGKDKQFWRRMSFALGKQRGGTCFRVQVEHEDETTEDHSSQTEVQEAIWDNIHRKRFHLAESAPLCQEPLRKTFGYKAICDTSKQILDGTYDFSRDFDEATKEILQECALIRLRIPADSINTLITKEDW